MKRSKKGVKRPLWQSIELNFNKISNFNARFIEYNEFIEKNASLFGSFDELAVWNFESIVAHMQRMWIILSHCLDRFTVVDQFGTILIIANIRYTNGHFAEQHQSHSIDRMTIGSRL